MYRLSIDSSRHCETSLVVSFFLACLLHMAFFGICAWHTSNRPPLKPKAKVIVQTIALAPKSPQKQIIAASEVSVVAIEKKEPIDPVPVPIPEIQEKKVEKKKESVSPKETSTEKPKVIQKEPKKVSETPKAKPVPKKEVSKKEPVTKNKKPPVKPKVTKEKVDKNQEETKKKVALQKTEEVKKAEETKAAIEKKKQEEKAAIEKKKNEEREAAEKKRNEERVAAEKKRAEEIKAAMDVENAILAKAKESFAKVGETRGKIDNVTKQSTDLALAQNPQMLGSLQVEALAFVDGGGQSSFSAKERRYSDEVAYRLKSSLRLPEYGAVKIKLTLSREGKVVHVETLHSENRKNKSYVEEKVKTLLFSSFGKEFSGAPEMTFVITLQND